MNTQPENEFDFWLGEWDVRWGEDGCGTNRIEKILGGRVIQENFSAPDLIGMSVSCFDPERQLWCQTWVDNNGTYLDFTGKSENEKMILERYALIKGQVSKQRMVWYEIEADKFEWNWERSDDGETWRVLWNIHYTRKK
ncbi:MAG: hypothetical protein HY863_19930 [Chloroflexi bacterium]|nr:hypothetical protein [Chloroflexota bacterium]